MSWRAAGCVTITVIIGGLCARGLRADEAWIDAFVEVKEAHNAGRWEACVRDVRSGRALAPQDRKPGFAVFGARCAAHAGDRAAFEAFVKAAGERMDWDEQHLLEMTILKIERERQAVDDIKPKASAATTPEDDEPEGAPPKP